MSRTNPMCRVCGDELNDDNWYSSNQKNYKYICKECDLEYHRLYKEKNPDKTKVYWTKRNRKHGQLPMSENKECSSHYGVYINEGVIKLYFNNVEVMPYGHPDYDFICKNGWKIDGKSSFTGDKGHWKFNIKRNTTTDYFFCVAYDNRKDKNILHIWILPGHKFNHLVSTKISKNTIDKWSEYEQPIDKAIMCCDSMKTETRRKTQVDQ